MGSLGSLLLIDDEPELLDLLRDCFEAQGYSVKSALNGRDALVLASLTRPDAVLLDIRMPGMPGPDVLAALRELDPTIAVVMVSGTDDESLARDLLKAGAFDYVRKPFVLDTLGEIVWLAVLTGRRPAREAPEPPRSSDPWPTAAEAGKRDGRCAQCRQSVPLADTSAVRDGRELFHATCWLRRSVEVPGESQAGVLLVGSGDA
jgi:DNA-binding response OmpR family regulator